MSELDKLPPHVITPRVLFLFIIGALDADFVGRMTGRASNPMLLNVIPCHLSSGNTVEVDD